MKCPYCGYDKNTESDETCRSCNRRLHRVRKNKIVQNQVYQPGITKIGVLRNWSRVSLQEYYMRFCPTELVRKMNNATYNMYCNIVCYLTLWVYIFIVLVIDIGRISHDYAILSRGMIPFFMGSCLCFGLCIDTVKSRRKFLDTEIHVAFIFTFFLMILPTWVGTYRALIFFTVIPILSVLYAEVKIEKAYKNKKLTQDVYGVEVQEEPKTEAIPNECPHCGYEKNKAGSHVCASCGKRLSKDARQMGTKYFERTVQFSKDTTSEEYLRKWHVLSLKDYFQVLCPQQIVRHMNAAIIGMAIGLVSMLAGIVRLVVLMWEFENEVDLYTCVVWGILSFGVSVFFLLKQRTIFSADCLLCMAVMQIGYIYMFLGVSTCMLYWVAPVIAIMLLNIAASRVVRAYDAKEIKEDFDIAMK